MSECRYAVDDESHGYQLTRCSRPDRQFLGLSPVCDFAKCDEGIGDEELDQDEAEA